MNILHYTIYVMAKKVAANNNKKHIWKCEFLNILILEFVGIVFCNFFYQLEL